MKHEFSWLLMLCILLTAGAVLTAGCAEKAIKSPAQQAPSQIIKDVTLQEAFTLIQENKDNPDFIIIDVRTPEEFAGGHIKDAVNIDFSSATFRDEISLLDKNKRYLIYCRSGNRSGQALKVMAELGFNEVYNLSVGIMQWVQAGFPTVK